MSDEQKLEQQEQELIGTTEKLFTRTRSRQHRNWIRIGIHLAVIGAFLALFLLHRLDRFENMVYDTFLKYSGFQKADPAIVLVEISDTALREIGEWPWPRRYHAVMARLLDEWGAAAVIFDVLFAGDTLPQDDQDLAQVLQKIKTPLYLPVDLDPEKERKFWLHGLPVVLDEKKGKMAWLHSLPGIEKNAKALGHRELNADPDGVLRRFEPYVSSGTGTFPLLAMPPAYDILKKPLPRTKELGWVVGSDGKILIPWIAEWREKFTRYNFEDLIHGFYGLQKGMRPETGPEKIKGKICLIGLTSAGRSEEKATPFEPAAPSVAAYAQVLNGVLTGQRIRVAPDFVNAVLLVAIGILATGLFFILRGALSLFAGLLLGLGWLVLCFLFFNFSHIWLFSVYPSLLILSLFIFSSIYVQLTASRERSTLFHLATRDGLTELYVIRHFRVIMNQIVREAFTRKEPLSVILLDIDHFKKINDTYGHPAGDMVLKKVAQLIISHIRQKRPFAQIDFAARYGGEEFIIMLRKVGLKEAAGRAAERIRQKIETARFEWEGKVIPVTISLGAAVLHPGENVPDPMVHRADAALYQAKETGRNRVCTEKE